MARTTSRYQDLVDVATRLFAELGYERTTVRAIADEMGIESGSLYSHISSKEEVLRQIVLHTATEFFDQAEAALQRGGEPEEQLRALCKAHLSVVHGQGAAVRVYFDEWRKLDGTHRDEVISLRERYEELFANVLRTGVELGHFKPLDTKWVVLVILSTLNWTPQWYSPRGALSPDTLADQLIEVVLAGLRAGDPSKDVQRP